MNQEQSRLYQRICEYSPDDGQSAFTFTKRLARDNGWSWKYAERVIEEYKKFMFLAVVADHPVTPSEHVDQAWHLHLIYTRSYWDDFCGQVLGTPIHHGPTKGGSDEKIKFCDLYERTKASYQRLLQETPPADIWPDAEQRFGDDVQCVRVNTRRHWIVSKDHAQRFALAGLALLLLVAGALYELPSAAENERLGWLSPDGYYSTLGLLNAPSNRLVRTAMWNEPHEIGTRVVAGPPHGQEPVSPNPPQNYVLAWGLVIGFLGAAGILAAAGIAMVAIFIVMVAILKGKCSACGRNHAMKKTGNSERGTGWFASTKDEWKCQYCGATTWTTNFAGCGGGCGASGCGGATHCGGGDAGCGGGDGGGGGCSGGGGCGGGGCGGGG
jgi:hypothetical protein